MKVEISKHGNHEWICGGMDGDCDCYVTEGYEDWKCCPYCGDDLNWEFEDAEVISDARTPDVKRTQEKYYNGE